MAIATPISLGLYKSTPFGELLAIFTTVLLEEVCTGSKNTPYIRDTGYPQLKWRGNPSSLGLLRNPYGVRLMTIPINYMESMGV